MTDPTSRNRLDEEASPYLRQHADNPVHWQPWDDAALAAAEERDVPIFLSVGYAACHWCHVMAEESFDDEAVADLLNEHYVPIKVDREERPDLDRIYQTVCQMVTGRGGWPLSAWLTPEGEPFHVGTYYPKESGPRGQGFVDLLESIATAWENDRDSLQGRADEWTAAVSGQFETSASAADAAPDAEVLETASRAALRGADRTHGGWGSSGPKFPQPVRLQMLLRMSTLQGDDEARSVAVETLDAMADRGLYDHVGGGFHRYATDRDWAVPHFEKMLYDNAELPRLYLDAHRLTGEQRYADVARETFAFVERELTHPDGGFFSTLDAQSEGEEGAFYVWTPAEVRDAMREDLADLFCDRYGVTSAGNFEGATVLTKTRSVAELAGEYDRPQTEVRERLEEARQQAFEYRADRPRPARDEKVIAGWNGLMTSALARGGLVLEETYADVATRALDFVREHLWDEDERRLARRYKDGDVAGTGFLEDYAFLGRGAFDCYQATGDVEHLEFALDLARTIEAEFYDSDAETLYFTPECGESLLTRPQEPTDQSTPSSTGVATDLLSVLDPFVPHDRFDTVVEGVLRTHRSDVEANPLQHASLVLAADRRARGSLEVTIAAEEVPADWRATLGERYHPDGVVSVRPPTADALEEWLSRLDLDDAPPIWAGREARDGEPTVYVCRNRTCSPPEHDLDAALEWAENSG